MIRHIKTTEIILYVKNQEESCSFYSKILRKEPDLNVPGMSEFIISDTCKLGLMPEKGIVKILENKISNLENASGIPRCELYFYVHDILLEFEHALKSGAKLLKPFATMDWGDQVC